MLMVLKYWKFIVLGIVVLGFAITVEILNNKIETLVKDNEILQSKVAKDEALLAVQNALILQNKSDYDVAVKKLPTVIKTINTKYRTVYSTVEKWRDKNETSDYNSSLRYLDSFTY